MTKVIFDSNVIIYLEKSGLFSDFCSLIDEIHIPQQVFYETVTRGKEHNYDDAWEIEELIGSFDNIFVESVDIVDYTEAKQFFHGDGEASAVALAKIIPDAIIITCDAVAAAHMRLNGIKQVLSLEAFILLYVKKQKLSKKKALVYLTQLRSIYAISQEKYNTVCEEVEVCQ